MKRRDFFAATGLASLTPLISSIGDFEYSSSDYMMGYQLYSIRDKMATDPIDTIKSLKTFGYRDFEIYGYDINTDSIYGMSSSEFRLILDGEGLTATSGHYGFSDYLLANNDQLKKFVDGCLTCAQTLGSDYITWPWLAPEYRTLESFKIMIDKLNIIADHLDGSGMGFAYHNHGFEFEITDGDQTGYDLIINNTDPALVKLQMDMYWVMHSAKVTPQKLVEENKGRFVMWHIKDMDTLTRDYTEVGNGSINYLNLLPSPEDSGLQYYYLEQGGNFAIDSLQSAKTSAKYCQENLTSMITK